MTRYIISKLACTLLFAARSFSAVAQPEATFIDLTIFGLQRPIPATATIYVAHKNLGGENDWLFRPPSRGQLTMTGGNATLHHRWINDARISSIIVGGSTAGDKPHFLPFNRITGLRRQDRIPVTVRAVPTAQRFIEESLVYSIKNQDIDVRILSFINNGLLSAVQEIDLPPDDNFWRSAMLRLTDGSDSFIASASSQDIALLLQIVDHLWNAQPASTNLNRDYAQFHSKLFGPSGFRAVQGSTLRDIATEKMIAALTRDSSSAIQFIPNSMESAFRVNDFAGCMRLGDMALEVLGGDVAELARRSPQNLALIFINITVCGRRLYLNDRPSENWNDQVISCHFKTRNPTAAIRFVSAVDELRKSVNIGAPRWVEAEKFSSLLDGC